MLELLGLDEMLGLGRFKVSLDQLESCTRHCDSGTPPLVIQKMTKEGKFDEVLKKRLSCKNCSLKLMEHYKPANNRVTYAPPDKNKNAWLEPYFKYEENPTDLMILWIEVIGALANYRKLPKEDIPAYAMQAVISRILKRAEYKVKNVRYGMEINPIFLEVDQLKCVEEGYSYQSQLDIYVLDMAMKFLEEFPI